MLFSIISGPTVYWIIPFLKIRVSALICILFHFKDATTVVPDQTLCSTASNLGLHCLPYLEAARY